MVLFLNGAFGIGKTTVARALQQVLPDAVLFDPERIGYFLRRIPRWAVPKGWQTGDYQNIPLWRSSTVWGIRAARALRPTVIVPMAFSNIAYLDEIRGSVGAFETDVRHFCLVAPLAVVQQRLRQRERDGPGRAWLDRRARECCEAHERPEFGEHIPAADRSVAAIVSDLVVRLQGQQPLGGRVSR